MLVCPRCRSIYRTQVRRCGIDGEELDQTDTDPLVGATLERYRVLARLAEGSMSAVYLAAHTVLEHRYALKVLYGDYGAQQALVERFRREATAAARIRHPNVVSVHDFGRSAEGLSFMVMELVEGRPLEEVMRRDGLFSPARVASFARQIALGLGAAHALGFVHRDVKPANLMVTRSRGEEQVKILDFGVARQTLAASATHATGSGIVVGTPIYMAPEQAADAGITPRADLYSLGVILYEMLVGKPPFDHPSVTNLLIHHITQVPPPLPPSGGLERLVKRLLNKRPEDRPSSAEEVVRAIDALGLVKKSELAGDAAMVTEVASPPKTARKGADLAIPTEDLVPPFIGDPLEAGFVGRGGGADAELSPWDEATSIDGVPGRGQASRDVLDVSTVAPAPASDLALTLEDPRGAMPDDSMDPTDSVMIGGPPLHRPDSFEETVETELPAGPPDLPEPPGRGREPPENSRGFDRPVTSEGPWSFVPRPSIASTSYAFSGAHERGAAALSFGARLRGDRRTMWILALAALAALAAVLYLVTV